MRCMIENAEVIGQCLWAAVDGPFFPDREFQTLFGLDRSEVRRIAESWPDWDEVGEQFIAVNNTLNNLLRYPHDQWDTWHDYVSATPVEVARVFERFREDARAAGTPTE
ncbi:hypothetical protein NJBCHELONAE_14880 [Mycobacteroides chelonae]|nr:hypothetical protein NJBCHELONAE_14880 [Mycobacteroides chelonae]